MKAKKNKNKYKLFKINNKQPEKKLLESLIKYICLFLFFPIYFSKEKYEIRKLNLACQTTVTIQGNGDQSYLYIYSLTRPDSISVEGVSTANYNIYEKKVFGLENNINNVTMKWSTPPTSLYKMFFSLKNITHVYFKGIISSQVTDMTDMFRECSSLVYVDFSDFDASSATNMATMFSNCQSLQSIDLSGLYAPQLITTQNMFESCSSLISLNLSNFNAPNLQSIEKMLFGCSKLENLDLTNFDTSTVTMMNSLFQGCKSLTSIDLSNFNTSSVKNMGGMFKQCESLTSLDLSYFDTSSVTTMTGMFEDSSNLISVNLGNLDTSSVEGMNNMFYECKSLKYLNLSNFDVRKVNTMENMFYGCNSLETLDLSSFVTSSLKTTKNLFCGCTSLISIDVSKFDTSKVEDMSLMFFNCTSLISLNLINFDASSAYSKSHDIFNGIDSNLIFCSSSKLSDISSLIQFTSDCQNTCFKDNKKIIVEKKMCTLNCAEEETFNLEYKEICYSSCPNNTHVTSDNPHLCQIEPEGYYLEGDIYKPCYSSCKTCFGEGTSENHKCKECNLNYIFINEEGKENNCYINCEPFYYYFDESNNNQYTCATTDECPNSNNKKISAKRKCINDCSKDNKYYFEYNNECFDECPENTYGLSNNIHFCLKDPDSFYLDSDHLYKPCYPSCKKCYGDGDDSFNNCEECISNYIFDNKNCIENCDIFYYDSHGNIICKACSDESNYIPDKHLCIENCKNDIDNQYEYNKVCYSICPNNTHGITENKFKCQLKPEGYYLNGDIYERCYSSCGTCENGGDNDNHNCEECKENYIFLNEIGKEKNCYPKCNDYYYFDINLGYQCISNCQGDYSKEVVSKKKCIDLCKNDDTYQLEKDNKCYDVCPTNTFVTVDNEDLCQSNPEGYYLDNNIYKHCYESCKTCHGDGQQSNHNCKVCKENYIGILNNQGKYNCYPICTFYYFFDLDDNYNCTETNECPKEQNKLIREKGKCIKDCSEDDTYRLEYNNTCVQFLPDEGIIIICSIDLPFEKSSECVEECTAYEFLKKECKLNNIMNKTAQDNMAHKIKEGIENKDLDELISTVKEDKNDLIVNCSDTLYQLTTSENQNINEDKSNTSSILLGDCEDKLKKENGILPSETLIIFKYDVYEPGLLIPTIEYEVYNPLTLEPLNLDICKEIEISIPVTIDEDNLFKYNSSDEYYTDICYSYTTASGTDIMVEDRQNEFNKNNMSLCESNCEYIKYKTKNKKAYCKCPPKLNLNSIEDIKNNKYKLIKHFMNLKSFVNLKILKCYKEFFDKKALLKNIGSYVIISVIFIQVLLFFSFIFKGYNILYVSIQQLVQNKSKDLIDKNNSKKKSRKSASNIYDREKIKKRTKNQKSKTQKLNKKNTKKGCRGSVSTPVKRIKSKMLSKSALDDNVSMKSNSKLELKYSDYKLYGSKKLSQRLSNKMPFLKKKLDNNFENNDEIKRRKNNFKTYINQVKISNFTDYELNTMIYEEALEIDRRSYTQYYTSLIKQKQLIIFTFCNNKDYNSKIIKICLFFFAFALYLTVNALFFNYRAMNHIYVKKGDYDFIFQIPQIIYSTLISATINMIIKTLSLSQKDIVNLKREKKNVIFKASKVIKCLNTKFIIFFILNFILLLSFWYYIGCFCTVYKNTQGYLIKDSLISFILALVYPIFLSIFPGIFRIPSLKSVNKNNECIYKFSQIIQLL